MAQDGLLYYISDIDKVIRLGPYVPKLIRADILR